MFKKSLLIASALIVGSSVISSSAYAEFGEKPTYANTIKAKQEKKEDEALLSASEKNKSENARAMLKSEELKSEEAKSEKQKSVLTKTQSGRLLESNKHISKE